MAKQRLARPPAAVSSGIAGCWQRDRSRGITRRIRYTEQLWAGAAGAGGASTTYLPVPAVVALAATLARFLD